VQGKWPGAYAALESFTISNDDMGAMITEVDLNGGTVEQVVADWMAANEGTWKAWIQ
jgi:glycine betaine/proline transport system substrate-binding protein